MKTKSLALGILLLIVLAIVSVFIFNFDKDVYKFSSIIVFGVIGGIITVLYSGFTTPTKWIFKYRFLIDGILFGIGVHLFSTLTNLTDSGNLDTSLFIRKFFVSAAVGILIFSSIQYWTYKVIKKRTPFKSLDGEMEIIADAATINNEDIAERGRMILTSNRLCFVSSKNGKIIFELDFTDSPQNIQIAYRMGIPTGIYIPANATTIQVRFSCFWLREIKKTLPNAQSIS